LFDLTDEVDDSSVGSIPAIAGGDAGDEALSTTNYVTAVDEATGSASSAVESDMEINSLTPTSSM
jgi:hypothetical protein